MLDPIHARRHVASARLARHPRLCEGRLGEVSWSKRGRRLPLPADQGQRLPLPGAHPPHEVLLANVRPDFSNRTPSRAVCFVLVVVLGLVASKPRAWSLYRRYTYLLTQHEDLLRLANAPQPSEGQRF